MTPRDSLPSGTSGLIVARRHDSASAAVVVDFRAEVAKHLVESLVGGQRQATRRESDDIVRHQADANTHTDDSGDERERSGCRQRGDSDSCSACPKTRGYQPVGTVVVAIDDQLQVAACLHNAMEQRLDGLVVELAEVFPGRDVAQLPALFSECLFACLPFPAFAVPEQASS